MGCAGKLGEVVVVPCVGVDEFVDVVVSAEIVDVLLAVELGLVSVDRASWSGRGCAGQLSEVVVTPCVGVVELVDVVVGAKVVDVLLLIEGGLVSVDRASRSGRGCAGQLSEIVMAPCVGVVELVDMVVGSDVVDVLLVVELGLVAVDVTSGCGWGGGGEQGEIVVVPLTVVEQLVDVIVGADEVDVLLVVEGGLVSVEAAPLARQQRAEGAGGLLIGPLRLDEVVSKPDGLAIADVPDFVAGVGVEPGAEGGVGDGFAKFVGADFGDGVEEGAGKDAAVAVGEGNNGVVDICAEGVMVAAELAA